MKGTTVNARWKSTSLVTRHARESGGIHVLLISGDESLARELGEIGEVTLTWIDGASGPDDIDMSVRADLAVVSHQLEAMGSPEDVNLLCRVRDCNCDEILIEISSDRPSAQELLAIGFYRDASAPPGTRRFRYDRDEFFEPRQWNTPEDWAHPENFKKYRW